MLSKAPLARMIFPVIPGYRNVRAALEWASRPCDIASRGVELATLGRRRCFVGLSLLDECRNWVRAGGGRWLVLDDAGRAGPDCKMILQELWRINRDVHPLETVTGARRNRARTFARETFENRDQIISTSWAG